MVKRLLTLVVLAALAVVGVRIYALVSGDRDVLHLVNAVSKPAVPVQVTFRRSALGNGLVARFNNESSNRLAVTVTFRTRSNQGERRTLELVPNGVTEVGWMEGWQFESGETVTVAHDDFAERTFKVP